MSSINDFHSNSPTPVPNLLLGCLWGFQGETGALRLFPLKSSEAEQGDAK
ncbi:MAG: hypothetical protein R2788_02725 [Saprospiraceae bacterium]